MRITLSFIIIFVAAGSSRATTPDQLVEYWGDSLPENSNPAFQFSGNATGTRSVSNGILTISNPNATGSLDYSRTDQLLVDDLAVFQFRARFTPAGSTFFLPSGVVSVRWVGDAPGQFLFFFADGSIRLRAGGGPTFVDNILPLDTSQYHTYTIAKMKHDEIDLFVDGNLTVARPLSDFRLTDLGPMTTGYFQRFQGNPKSITDWDFFRYAIGDNALNMIPVPEPETSALLLLSGLLSSSVRRRRMLTP